MAEGKSRRDKKEIDRGECNNYQPITNTGSEGCMAWNTGNAHNNAAHVHQEKKGGN